MEIIIRRGDGYDHIQIKPLTILIWVTRGRLPITRCGNSASLSNYNFEVISTITLSDTIDDANPADVIEDFITHPRYGPF